jgi:transcriptional regulator with XRE-family HTH domain
MESELTKWVKDELQKRHWSIRELARQAGLSHSTISQTLNERITVSNNFCLSIAQAFGEPPEKVFRLAGILPPSASEDDSTFTELVEMARTLTPQERREVLYYMSFLLHRRKK